MFRIIVSPTIVTAVAFTAGSEARLEGRLVCVSDQPLLTAARVHEPAGHAVNLMTAVLDELAAMALDPSTLAEVEAEEIGLRLIISRASLSPAFVSRNRGAS